MFSLLFNFIKFSKFALLGFAIRMCGRIKGSSGIHYVFSCQGVASAKWANRSRCFVECN